MFSLLLLALLAFVAHKTHPDSASFRKYWEETSSSGSSSSSDSTASSSTSATNKLTNFFHTILTGKPLVPEFRFEDYMLFSLATLRDGSATYLGVFGQWFPLNRVELVGGLGVGGDTRTTKAEVHEARASNERERADDAKRRKDYGAAAKTYINAAHQYQKAGDSVSTLEAASCFEDAYKMFRQLNQTNKALQALHEAASIYEHHHRDPSRAARIYEQLAEKYKEGTDTERLNLEKALSMYRKAAELFEINDDGRWVSSRMALAGLAAELGLYEEAIEAYDRVIRASADDSVRRFLVGEHVLNLCLCVIAKDDWEGLRKTITKYAQYPSFENSREHRFLSDLVDARDAYDVQMFTDACQRFDNNKQLKPWQVTELLSAKRKLDKEDLR